jgi:phytoene dehydrogenase-like protein
MKILVSHFPLLTAMMRWRGITINRFVAGLKNPLLRDAFASFNKLGLSADLPMLALVMFLAWSIQKSAGFPEGGGLEMIRAIESHLLTLGGRIRYRARVEKIMVENGQASGIRLVDGSEVRADFVISAADGKTTVFNLLEGKYLDQRRRLFYEKTPVAPAVTILAFGVKRIFNDLPHSTLGYVFPLAKPETIGGVEQTVLRPMVYNFDPSLSPADRTLIRLFIPSDYDFWQGLGYQSERYYSEKKRLAATVISLLEQRFPGISKQLEMQDVATPLTFERYTGNHRGSTMGWAADGKSLMQPLPKTLPGLRHFYLAGHWAEIGAGVPGSAMSGRSAIQHICRSEKKDFISASPGQAGLAVETGNG